MLSIEEIRYKLDEIECNLNEYEALKKDIVTKIINLKIQYANYTCILKQMSDAK